MSSAGKNNPAHCSQQRGGEDHRNFADGMDVPVQQKGSEQTNGDGYRSGLPKQ